MIRRLGLEDQQAYRALWLDGLHRAPTAFLLTDAEARGVTDSALVAKLTGEQIWGAFVEDRLAGMIAMTRGKLERLRHMADVGPLYVHPDAQGQGLGRGLLMAVEQAAREMGLLQLELSVDRRNKRARDLYLSCGYVQFGLRPRSVLVDGIPRDDILMLKALDA